MYINIKNKLYIYQFTEKTVIEYAETLTTATISRISAQNNEIPKPHPCAKTFCSFTARDLDYDYECIINCCQRHVCRLIGYCKSSKKVNQCRFGYLFSYKKILILYLMKRNIPSEQNQKK